MSNSFLTTTEYQNFISQIKQSIQQSRYVAVRMVNSELIQLYYLIGQQITEKQKSTNWGDDLIGQVETDLKLAFPDVSGFSRRNLNYMRRMYEFIGDNEFVPQLVAQIPWGHIRLILDKIKDIDEAIFYVKMTMENSWSRIILDHQIDLRLYERQGKIINNFNNTVPIHEIDLLKESFKETYVLDFLGLENDFKERELEQSLVNNISKFILELGKGFAFVGKQYKLTVGDQEFFIDLLFYNFKLKRFVVIELKNTEFKPEYIGQIGFYLTAIDRDVRQSGDGQTVGLVICKSKNNTVVEYALSNISQPAGVAEYKLFSDLPEDLRNYLPSESDLNRLV